MYKVFSLKRDSLIHYLFSTMIILEMIFEFLKFIFIFVCEYAVYVGVSENSFLKFIISFNNRVQGLNINHQACMAKEISLAQKYLLCREIICDVFFKNLCIGVFYIESILKIICDLLW